MLVLNNLSGFLPYMLLKDFEKLILNKIFTVRCRKVVFPIVMYR